MAGYKLEIRNISGKAKLADCLSRQSVSNEMEQICQFRMVNKETVKWSSSVTQNHQSVLKTLLYFVVFVRASHSHEDSFILIVVKS